jgi:hypothetical protein
MNNEIYITMCPLIGNENKIGKCVIRYRITYNRQRKEFITLISESNINRTQVIRQEYYGRVVMKKVSEDMKKINRRI